ncbi:MAG: hypothetical protein CBD63_01075 [Candidatus Pelagibacter sp. TMED203]|jgi:hypothetical protein|nr:MAG: hypothetical protein CBD63_01075 [Candidatus Pelagibacter sp. TMED203]|tara:strand:+ start:254 stop:526 length:273 start_codon:yes stop_codon:yes gene_type:complete
MVKLKSLLKEWNDTSFKSLPKRWSKPIDSFRDEKFDGLTELERKEGVANPITQKYDFKKPTVVHLSKKEMEILYTQGQIETDGLTIIYEQ